jgi:uncharacterized protein YndB with AHSA1/START domain
LSGARIAGDEVNVSVLVEVEPERAFAVFTREIDQWWRRGLRYRIARGDRGVLHLEPKVGGRLFESFETSAGPKVVSTGTVTVWEPPSMLVFEWRAVNFAQDEKTVVEIRFEPASRGTLVTVKHRGWSRIRPDHPARHGMEVGAFLRMMGLWWGDLMTSLRQHVVDSR